MSDIATIALDLAKNIFQVQAVDATGAVVVRRRLRRREAHTGKWPTEVDETPPGPGPLSGEDGESTVRSESYARQAGCSDRESISSNP